MKGILYAVGVGPGDPELLTLKAAGILKSVDVIACPAKAAQPGIAYKIAVAAVPEILRKKVAALDFPMTTETPGAAHEAAVETLSAILEEGKDVAFLTLGDPSFYSTFSYISDRISQRGIGIRQISGVTSFSAAAAELMIPIALGNEQVLITSGEYKEHTGTLVIMKVGRKLKELKEAVRRSGREAFLVENCGMEGERIFKGVEEMPSEAGYFSIMIVK